MSHIHTNIFRTHKPLHKHISAQDTLKPTHKYIQIYKHTRARTHAHTHGRRYLFKVTYYRKITQDKGNKL